MLPSISSKLLKTSFSLLLIASSCNRVSTEKLEPQITYCVQDRFINRLPSAFSPLTISEKESDWGREYNIGLAFAKELDLYRAITAFKRAAILMPAGKRKNEVEYNILLSYYLGHRYEEVVETFKCSCLRRVDGSFPAYHDLLLIIYESQMQLGEVEAAELIYNHMRRDYPETAEKLKLSTALKTADFRTLNQYIDDKPYINDVLTCYEAKEKSISKAELLNGILPGMGYAYVGQKQSAVTSFFLNGLFIAAATYFFLDGNLAAGLIATSFEAGWYFGGIYGAGESAKLYNERTYEKCAYPVMAQNKLFPVLSLKYAF